MSVRITIDRIAVDGLALAPEQQDAFREQLIGELERRLAEDWVDGLADRRQGELQLPPLDVAANAQPAGMASAVASRTVEGLKG